MEQLVQQITFLTTTCEALQEQVNRSNAENNAAAYLAQLIPQTSPSPPKLKLNPPEPFKGQRDSSATKVSNFISQCQLYMDNTPGFTTDAIRISFAASYLKEEAYTWIASYLALPDLDKLQAENIWLLDWSLFKEKLESTFGDPDRKTSNALKLHSLRQKSSAALYASEFRRLSLTLGWNDSALMFIFQHGLKPAVKDEFARIEPPTSLTAMIDRAITIDNRLHLRTREKNSAPASSYTSNSTSQNSRSDKMDVDATHTSYERGPLSDDEKERRRTSGLCLYCAQSHNVKECPQLAKKDANMRTAAAFTITSPNNIPLGPKEDGLSTEE
jgi:hypothetical protein